MYRYPVINWGRGRLLPYESLGAFCAKFCRLNGLAPKEFRDFLYGLIRKDCWQSSKFDISSVKSLARLLDEKVSVVEKLDPSKLQLPGCYGTFNFLKNTEQLFEQVAYCPECIRKGYHASFHESPWLNKCPIHLTNLLKSSVDYRGCGSKFDRYANTLANLLDHECATWLEINTHSVVVAEMENSDFRLFAKWIKAIQKYQVIMDERNLISLWGTDYSLENIDALIGRVSWVIPFPKRLHELFHANVSPLQPNIINCPIDLVNRLSSLLTQVRYDNLAWFYKKTIALAKESLNKSAAL